MKGKREVSITTVGETVTIRPNWNAAVALALRLIEAGGTARSKGEEILYKLAKLGDSVSEGTIADIIHTARSLAKYGDDNDDWGWSAIEEYHQTFWNLLNKLDGTNRKRR